ncbi:MAG: hypothetical protein ABJB01_11010, partial [Rudaea sp.]
MAAQPFLETLASRAPWAHVGRVLLMKAGIPVARGWQNTLAASELLEEKARDAEPKLAAALDQHLIAGEKSVQFFDITGDQKKQLDQFVRKSKFSKSVFLDHFPNLLPVSDLASNGVNEPVLLKRIELSDGMALIYASIRSYHERVEISKSDLKASKLDDGYEELYAIRRRNVQTFDALWIPANGLRICTLVDLPVGAPKDFSLYPQEFLRKVICKAVGDNDVPPLSVAVRIGVRGYFN